MLVPRRAFGLYGSVRDAHKPTADRAARLLQMGAETRIASPRGLPPAMVAPKLITRRSRNCVSWLWSRVWSGRLLSVMVR